MYLIMGIHFFDISTRVNHLILLPDNEVIYDKTYLLDTPKLKDIKYVEA